MRNRPGDPHTEYDGSSAIVHPRFRDPPGDLSTTLPRPRPACGAGRRPGRATRRRAGRRGGTSRAGSAPRWRRGRGCGPSLLAAGESSRWPESVGLIWKRTRISNSRSAWWSKARFRLFTVSHQAMTWTPRPGPSRRIVVEVVGGAGVLLAVREKPKSSSRRRRSRNRGRSWMNRKISGPSAASGCWRRSTSAASSARIRRRVAPAADRRRGCGRTPATLREDARPGDGPRACRRGRRTGPRADRVGRGRRVLGGQARRAPTAMTPSAASSFWPTIRRWLPLWRRKTADGRVLDRDRVAEPGLSAERGGVGPGRRRRAGRRAGGSCDRSAGSVPLEDDRRARQDGLALAARSWSCFEVGLAALVGEPDDLEEVVPLDHAVGVVVDRLAGAGEQPGGGVLLAQDQVGVGLAALRARSARPSGRACSGPARRRRRGSASRGWTWMPKARPWRTRRSSRSAASWASLSSSTKNSWNSSTISRMRGRGGVPGALR